MSFESNSAAPSAASARSDASAQTVPTAPLRVVTVGGGTGQPSVIRALRTMTVPLELTAVVAMADDGRSTGILREREGILPPGDVRKCLVALARDPASPLARAFEHRFSYLDGHAMGNLLITALADEGLSFPAAIEELESMLRCVGRVLPSTLDQVSLAGRTAVGEELAGQAALSYGAGRLDCVRLDPAHPKAFGPAVDAILAADLVVLGPGSLFTSLMPNLLVPGIAAALRETHGTRVFFCSKAEVPGEAEGMDAEAHVDALERQGFLDLVDVAVFHRADPAARPGFSSLDQHAPLYPDVPLAPGAEARLARRVPRVLVRDLADAGSCTSEDPLRVAGVLREIMDGCGAAARVGMGVDIVPDQAAITASDSVADAEAGSAGDVVPDTAPANATADEGSLHVVQR